MDGVVDTIESVARPVIENAGLVLVDIVLRGRPNSRVLEVFVDSERGVTTEMCADLSRLLMRELEHADLLPGNYTLVVSSPGVDRPLKFPVQYRRNIGRELELIVQDGMATKNFKGILLGCTDTDIEVQTGANSCNVPYSAIVQAKVLLPW